MNIKLPNFELVNAVHELILMVSGGRAGIHDEKLIHSAVSRPSTYIQYVDEYDLDTICAILIDSIARYHGFNDGNKRTALMTAILTYKMNDVTFKATKKMNVEFDHTVMWVVNDKPSIDEIKDRLRELRDKHEGGNATYKSLLIAYTITKNPIFKRKDFLDN